MRERDQFIDNVRGFSMLIVIITHALVPYLSNRFILTLWDRIHFAVPMLVFCSGYILFAHQPKPEGAFQHIGKRVSRLLGPYYLYAIAFIATAMALGKLQVTPLYILQSLSITGGVDVSWFVLLFMYLAIISPLLSYLLNTHRTVFHTVASISIVSSLLLLFKTPSIDYKWYMWVPWLLPYMFGYYYRISRESHRVLLLTVIPLLFAIAYIMRDAAGMPLSIISNKYPPTLYYLTYGLTALMLISYADQTIVFTHSGMRNIWMFFSKYSYSLFFIHYFLLFLLDAFRVPRMMPPYIYVPFIVSTSVALQFTWNAITSRSLFLPAEAKKKI